MANGLFGTSTPEAQLQQERLRPTGVVSSPTLRAQQVQRGGNLQALTDALGGLNSALVTYAKVDDKIKDDPNSNANKEWIAKARQLDQQGLLDLARSGEADGHRAREDALNALLGDRAQADFLPFAETHFQTEFDRSTGDVAAEYDRIASEYAEALPNEIAKANFLDGIRGHRARTIGGVTDERIATAKQQINTTIVDGWYTKITEAAKDGELDPAAVAQAIFQGSEANEAFFGLSGAEQDATIWSLAQRLAVDGKVAEAEALLNTPRKGSNGDTLPALSEIAEYAVKGKSLLESAKTAKVKAAQEGSAGRLLELEERIDAGTLTLEDVQADIASGLLTERGAATLVSRSNDVRRKALMTETLAGNAERAENEVLHQASIAISKAGGIDLIEDVEVPTKSGATRTMTRKEIIERTKEGMEQKWSEAEAKMIEDGATPEEAASAIDDVRQTWHITRFVKNDQWARTFAALPSRVTPLALEKNPGLAAKAASDAERYRSLREKSPAYAATLVDGKSADFLEVYAAAREIDGLPPEEAIAAAAGYAAMTRLEKARNAPTKAEMTKLTQKVLSNKGVYGGKASATVASTRVIEDQIERLSALGVPADMIEDRIGEWVSERTITINGTLVPVQDGMEGDFPMLVERHLNKVFEEKGKLHDMDSAADLTIAPVHGENYWVVVDNRTGLAVGSMDLTKETLRGLQKELREEERAEIAANLAAQEADAAERKQKFEDRVSWYDEYIAYWGGKNTKLGRMYAESAEAAKQRYINENNPEWVREQQEAKDADMRKRTRIWAERNGHPDPFPEDGPLE